jgi:hypothetical protein
MNLTISVVVLIKFGAIKSHNWKLEVQIVHHHQLMETTSLVKLAIMHDESLARC